MITVSQLIQVMSEKYFFLKLLDSKSELLKYFVVDKNGLFTVNPLGEIEDEFVDRFKGNFPKKGKYHDTLLFYCFKNYISNLEEAINFAEKMN